VTEQTPVPRQGAKADQGAPPADPRQHQANRPLRSKLVGLLLMVAVPSVAAVFLYAYGPALISGDVRSLYLVAVAFILGGAFLFHIGRRMRLPDGWEVLERDRRAPVLFLRSFSEDIRKRLDRPVGEDTMSKLTRVLALDHASQEAQLARAFYRLGPFVAVGRPTDLLAPSGAARLYVAHDRWQATVQALLAKSAAIVLQPDGTEGILWELDAVRRTVNLQRILLIVPDPAIRPLGYWRVRELTAMVLPVPLPPDVPTCNAFMFDSSGAPRPLAFGRRPRQAVEPFLQQVRHLTAMEAAA
jgi:hypothetical protein